MWQNSLTNLTPTRYIKGKRKTVKRNKKLLLDKSLVKWAEKKGTKYTVLSRRIVESKKRKKSMENHNHLLRKEHR